MEHRVDRFGEQRTQGGGLGHVTGHDFNGDPVGLGLRAFDDIEQDQFCNGLLTAIGSGQRFLLSQFPSQLLAEEPGRARDYNSHDISPCQHDFVGSAIYYCPNVP